MVKKFTLLELHLDEARFSNAVAGTPEAAEEMLGEMDAEMMDETMADEMESTSGRSIGRTLRRAAFLVVVAVGIRTIARRFLADDESIAPIDLESDDESIAVDVDERAEA